MTRSKGPRKHRGKTQKKKKRLKQEKKQQTKTKTKKQNKTRKKNIINLRSMVATSNQCIQEEKEKREKPQK